MRGGSDESVTGEEGKKELINVCSRCEERFFLFSHLVKAD